MSDGSEFSEVSKVPEIREAPEVAEVKQDLDRATLEPEAAVERSADIKTAEAVEAAVKEAVEASAATEDGGRGTEEAAVPAADGGQRTGDREGAAVAVTEDGRPRTEEDEGAVIAATEDGGRGTEKAAEAAADRRPETEDRSRETGNREGTAGAATGDGGPVTEEREAEAIETILTSDIANTSASTDASRDAYKAAIDTLQEHAQRQNEVADIGSRPSAPPEGDPGAEDLSDESPVQAVSSTAAETSTDFTVEMTGAQPGEVRGFENETDGSQTYELKTDGQTETQTVQEHLEDLEAAQGTPAESAEAVTLRPVEETAYPVVEEASAESGEVQRGDELEVAAAPTLGTEYTGEQISPEAAKAVGEGASSGASGIPVDDAQEERTQDATPVDTARETTAVPLEPGLSSSAAASEMDPASLAQEAIRESYLESQEDLADQADKVRFINTQKESVQSNAEELRSAILPETSSETLAEGLSQVLVPETAGSPLPGGMVISGALDGMTQLKEATGNGGSDEGELSPTEDGNDDSDSPVDATPQTSSVSGIGETGDNQENTELYQLQIAELEKRIETLEKQINELKVKINEEKQKLAQLQEMLKDIWTEEPVKPSREDFPSGEYGDADYADAINTYNNQTEDFQQQIFQLQSQITNTDETIHALQDDIKVKSEEIQQATKKINDLMGLLGSESNQNIPTDPVDSPSGSIGISTDSGSAAPPPSGNRLDDD